MFLQPDPLTLKVWETLIFANQPTQLFLPTLWASMDFYIMNNTLQLQEQLLCILTSQQVICMSFTG